MVFGRSRRSQSQIAAEALHDALIAIVRRPAFYLGYGALDTFQGRFDLFVLLAAVPLRRLRGLGPEGQEIAQHLVDTMFARFDIAMRELGVSDVGVPKRMKKLAEAFKGRTAAYDEALGRADRQELSAAISRNVLDETSGGERLSSYILEADAAFTRLSLDELRSGVLPFPTLAEDGPERP